MENQKRNLIIIFIVSCFIFLFNLDMLPVNIMEARNFITAREMVEDGNWISTTMNGIPRYEKPPLPTWLTAFSGMVGGLDNLTFLRLPAAICSIILMLYFYLLNVRITKNEELSKISTLIAATSYLIVFMGRQGTWDIFCHTFTVISIYYLFKALQSDEKEWSNWLLGGTFIGLSILSKGPVSLYALLLPFLISYGIVFNKDIKSKFSQILVCFLITLIIGGSWYGYITFIDGETANEISNKETTAWVNRNIKPFYRYFSFFVQSGIWILVALISLFYPSLKDKVILKKEYKLFLSWTIFSVILLSLIPEKKERYLLPVMIPLASTSAFYIHYLIKKSIALSKYENYLAKFIFGLIAIVSIFLPFAFYILGKDVNLIRLLILGGTTILLGVYILFNLKQNYFDKVFFGVVSFMTIFVFIGMPLILNIFPENDKYSSIKILKDEVKNYDLDLISYEFYSPEFWFNYGKKITDIDNQSFDINKMPEEFLLITSKEDKLIKKLSQYDATIKSLKSFDNNMHSEESSTYTDRLVYTLFIIEKK